GGALASAVWAEEAKDRMPGDLQVQPFKRLNSTVVVSLAQAMCVDHQVIAGLGRCVHRASVPSGLTIDGAATRSAVFGEPRRLTTARVTRVTPVTNRTSESASSHHV